MQSRVSPMASTQNQVSIPLTLLEFLMLFLMVTLVPYLFQLVVRV